jgi:hypothetical protein
MDTLYVDPLSWDLALDSSANIALAGGPYSLAQDAASAIKTFQSELWYDTTQGVPFFGDILGQSPPLELIRTKFVAAALTVPGVATAKVFFTGTADRRVVGQVQVTNSSGVVSAAGFF